jgi:hypothetical protein
MISQEELRDVLYSFLLRKDVESLFDLDENTLRLLNQTMASDMRNPQTSIKRKIAAGFLRKDISRDVELDRLPAFRDYW